MKGLELSQKYYESYGEKMINEKFHHYRDRIATGLVGQGSECFGFDDAISRDHDWGPGFCLWLDDDVFKEIGKPLQEAYDKLPKVFMGFVRSEAKNSRKRVGVFRIGEFYQSFTGLSKAPENTSQWMNLSDAYLCACTNGRLFSDPSCKFSNIRQKLLNFYPEDIRKFKIASKCLHCAQSGQYNFMRSINRKENFAAAFASMMFCSNIISLVFLLKRKFTPFYKWKHRAVRDLGILGKAVYKNISSIISTNNFQEQNQVIENTSALIISELKIQRLSDSRSDFMLDHGMAVQQSIKDKTLRESDAWGE